MKYVFVSVALIALGAQAFKADQRTLSVALQREDSSIGSLSDEVQGPMDETTGAGTAAAASKDDETTDTGDGAAVSKKEWVLDILTDFGEETDDEVMVTAACLIALKDKTMQLNIVFLDKDPTAQKKNLQAFLGTGDWDGVEAATNIAFYPSDEGMLKFEQLAVSAKEMKSAGKKHYVLQVGPIHGKSDGFDAYTSALKHVSYSYALVGTMGNTLNSKETAKAAAMELWEHATSKAIVDTAKGAGAFKFSYSVMKKFFKGKDALLDHVVKIGFRNTVGRADSKSGMFVANLVATQKSSANYQTVKSVEKSVGACTSATTSDITDGEEEGIAKDVITDGEEEGIAKVVNQYYKALTEANPPLKECDTLLAESKALGGDWKAVHKSCEACKQTTCASTTKKTCFHGTFCRSSGKLNAPGNPTADQVKEGYAFILKTLKDQFNVPIDLIVSGEAGAWQKTWDGIDKSIDVVPFKPQYSGIADDTFNEMVRKSFETWKKKVETCDIPMTPNYDSVGLIYAMLEMHGGIGKEFACGDKGKMNMNTCQLQSARVHDPASFEYFLSGYVE